MRVPPTPIVSVLIPSYNHSAFIGETLASAMHQTVRNIEIVVVDDGSTDHSVHIIENLARKDSRIRLLRQDNRGLVYTLNRLADEAKAPFVAQIDSDDIWTPERLAWGLEDMHGDQNLSVAFTSYLRIDAQGHPVPRVDQLLDEPLGREALVGRMTVKNSACACTAFMRQSALKKIGDFARPLTLSHDWDRWLRLSLVGTMSMRPNLGAWYRHHDQNQSLDVASTRRQELLIHDDLSDLLIAHHQLDPVQQVAIFGRAAALAYDTQQPQKLVHYLLKKSRLCQLFEHEQVWLLHLLLQHHMQAQKPPPWSQGLHRGLFSRDNQQRFDLINARSW